MAIENSMEEEPITQRHHNGLLNAATAAFSHAAVAAKNGGGEFLPLSDDSGEDEELTSLAWLQDTNLLKNIQMYGAEDISLSSAEFTNQSNLTNGAAGAVTSNSATEENNTGNKDSPSSANSSSVCVQYNPRVHINAKPPYSFSCLIFMAIENSPGKALPVKDIYSWILTHFPYFQHAPIGWKNSVRHNLSLNKCFRKVDKKGQNIGKGSLWCIDPEFRPSLIQNLKRAPDLPLDSHLHHLTAAIATTEVTPSTPNGNSAATSDSQPASPASSNVNLPSPDLFPFLSRRLAASNVKEFEVKSDPDVDAAATMLALKNGREYSDEDPPKNPLRTEKKHRAKLRSSFPGYQSRSSGLGLHQGASSSPVITSSPSEDHTYSASLCHRMTDDTTSSEEDDEDEEEHKKLAEGAQLLLELAQISRFPSSQNRLPADIRVDSA